MASTFLAAALAAGSLAAAEAQWTDNFDQAKAKAIEKNVPIFALFTGSDWCPWCVKLEKEVLAKPEFADYASKNLILFKADFPRKTKLQPGVAKQNDALQSKYGIEGFPTVLLLDGNGKVLGKTGYEAGGPAKYVENIKSLLSQKKK
jgi:protein disulfide-isomerase